MGIDKHSICVSADDDLKTVLSCLQQNAHRLCIVIGEDERIIGTITDGDCRRALLKGLSLETPASKVMNQQFIVVDESFTMDNIKQLMKSNNIEQVPIVDFNRRFKNVVSTRSLTLNCERKSNPVLILAGGKGTRLMPLTQNMPKPMLPVAGKPMLERLVKNIVDAGYENIYLSINYLGHIIEEYFGNGDKFSCNIKYLREDKELGTGGPLLFLDGITNEPILALNGDLVTDVDFEAILDFHTKHNFDLTVGISTYMVEIPFGVINFTEGGDIDSISEKPRHNFHINAGVYVVNPCLIKTIPAGLHYPMTSLINQSKSEGKKVGAFPIHEIWNDVGILKQYLEAQEPNTR